VFSFCAARGRALRAFAHLPGKTRRNVRSRDRSEAPDGLVLGLLSERAEVVMKQLLTRLGLALSLALVVPACAPMEGEDVAASEGELTVCAHGATVEGIDVSSWQGHIDWSAVARSGVRYAIVRIGDGTYHDPRFSENWRGAHAAGLIRGAYQYFEPRTDPIVQANLVIDAVGHLGAGDLPVTIDVEKPSPGVSPAAYARAIHRWVDRVTTGTGRRPIIYTGRYYWDPYVASSDFRTYPLWHAQYTSASCPNINDRWHDWAFWQYTSSGRVSGIAGRVDRNRFNGTFTQLQALAGIETCSAHCSGNTLVSASCHHTDCTASGSRCTAAGGTPHCAFDACPATGSATVCVDDHTVGTCRNGAVTRSACGAHAYCSTAGGATAHCVSDVCVSSAHEAPTAHDVCTSAGLAHCSATGQLGTAHACASGSTCETVAMTASCVAPMTSEPDAGAPEGSMGFGGGLDTGDLPHLDLGHDAGSHFVGDGGVSFGDAQAMPPRPGVQVSSGCSVTPGARAPHAVLAGLSIVAVVLASARRRRR
jgi:GH25 family lysozyme M1 (1,4-beta-N-acetylmuramidase)